MEQNIVGFQVPFTIPARVCTVNPQAQWGHATVTVPGTKPAAAPRFTHATARREYVLWGEFTTPFRLKVNTMSMMHNMIMIN